jgi:hypothetical protein
MKLDKKFVSAHARIPKHNDLEFLSEKRFVSARKSSLEIIQENR